MNWRLEWLVEQLADIAQAKRWEELCLDTKELGVLNRTGFKYGDAIVRLNVHLESASPQQKDLLPSVYALRRKLRGNRIPTIREILEITNPMGRTIPTMINRGVKNAANYMLNAEADLDLPLEQKIFTPAKLDLSDSALAVAIIAHLHEQVCIQLLNLGLVKDDIIHAIQEVLTLSWATSLNSGASLYSLDADLYAELYAEIPGSTGWVKAIALQEMQEKLAATHSG